MRIDASNLRSLLGQAAQDALAASKPLANGKLVVHGENPTTQPEELAVENTEAGRSEKLPDPAKDNQVKTTLAVGAVLEDDRGEEKTESDSKADADAPIVLMGSTDAA